MNEVPVPVKCQDAEPCENRIWRSIGPVHADPRTTSAQNARTKSAATIARINASRAKRKRTLVSAVMLALRRFHLSTFSLIRAPQALTLCYHSWLRVSRFSTTETKLAA
jgi:hypothetical protein